MEQENATESEAVFWRGSFGSVLIFIFTILVAWIVFKLYRVLGTIVMMLREVFLFWNITFSSFSRRLPKPLRLHGYICETTYLDEVGVNELYHFIEEDFKQMTVTDFHKAMLKYTHIMLCRDRVDGTLRGTLLINIEHKGDYTLISIGAVTFKNYYRGSPFLNITILSFMVRELLRHPLTPIYFIGKLYGYKAYLFVADFNRTYPHYDRETPEIIKKVIDDYAEMYDFGWSKDGRAKYNPETNVIEQEHTYPAEHLTSLSEQDLKNPHIKFFVERNPGWKKGNMLVVAVQVGWSDIPSLAKVILWRILNRWKRSKATKKSGRKKKAPPPKLLKRYTFQELNANTYAVNNLEYDMTGEVVLSPTTKAPFVFQTITEDSEVNSPGPTEFNIDLPTLTLI